MKVVGEGGFIRRSAGVLYRRKNSCDEQEGEIHHSKFTHPSKSCNAFAEYS